MPSVQTSTTLDKVSLTWRRWWNGGLRMPLSAPAPALGSRTSPVTAAYSRPTEVPPVMSVTELSPTDPLPEGEGWVSAAGLAAAGAELDAFLAWDAAQMVRDHGREGRPDVVATFGLHRYSGTSPNSWAPTSRSGAGASWSCCCRAPPGRTWATRASVNRPAREASPCPPGTGRAAACSTRWPRRTPAPPARAPARRSGWPNPPRPPPVDGPSRAPGACPSSNDPPAITHGMCRKINSEWDPRRVTDGSQIPHLSQELSVEPLERVISLALNSRPSRGSSSRMPSCVTHCTSLAVSCPETL